MLLIEPPRMREGGSTPTHCHCPRNSRTLRVVARTRNLCKRSNLLKLQVPLWDRASQLLLPQISSHYFRGTHGPARQFVLQKAKILGNGRSYRYGECDYTALVCQRHRVLLPTSDAVYKPTPVPHHRTTSTSSKVMDEAETQKCDEMIAQLSELTFTEADMHHGRKVLLMQAAEQRSALPSRMAMIRIGLKPRVLL